MRSLVMSGNAYRRAAVRWLGVAGVVGLLVFAAACGSDNNSGPPITGNFNNSSLNGQYAYSLSGNMLLSDGTGNSDYYVLSGVFTADGNGNITNGTEDFAQSQFISAQMALPGPTESTRTAAATWFSA